MYKLQANNQRCGNYKINGLWVRQGTWGGRPQSAEACHELCETVHGEGNCDKFSLDGNGGCVFTGPLNSWNSCTSEASSTGNLCPSGHLTTAEAVDDLAAGLRVLPTLAASLMCEGVPGPDIAAVLSGQYRAALHEGVWKSVSGNQPLVPAPNIASSWTRGGGVSNDLGFMGVVALV